MLFVGPPQRSKSRDQTKRDPSGPPGWRFGIVITMPHQKIIKKLIVTVTRSIDNKTTLTATESECWSDKLHHSLMHLHVLGRQEMMMMIHELHS